MPTLTAHPCRTTSHRRSATIRDAGVIVGRNNDTVPGLCNVLTISPPLTLTLPEADTIIAAVKAGTLLR